MPSTAISAQGTTLKLGATGTQRNITAITKANPARVTATAHGYADGAIALVASAGGMTEINSRYGMVKVVDANNVDLYGIDSTSFTTYTSGGTLTPSQVKVGNMLTYNGPDGQASDIDISNLDSVAKEYLVGLQDNGNFGFTLNPDDADAGQLMLLASRAGSLRTTCLLTLRNGKTRTFQATCKQFAEQAGVDQALSANVSMRVSGDVTRG